MRQPHHGGDQDVEGGLLLVDGVVEEAALEPEAGVVDQQVDRPRLRRRAGPRPSAIPRAVGQVGDQHLARDAVRSRDSSSASASQPVLVAGDQDEVVAALGETLGEDAPDAGGGAGDEGDGAGGGWPTTWRPANPRGARDRQVGPA